MTLDALQQVIDLHVTIAIVRIGRGSTLAKEGISLVEKQDCRSAFGGVEDPAQVLLRLADVLADDAAEVDAMKRERRFVRHGLRSGHSCHSTVPRKQHAYV